MGRGTHLRLSSEFFWWQETNGLSVIQARKIHYPIKGKNIVDFKAQIREFNDQSHISSSYVAPNKRADPSLNNAIIDPKIYFG